MKKLWSASNVKVYGGGVSEGTFLEDLSRLIGDYDRLSSSTSTGKGHRTVSQQLHRERILDVADLAEARDLPAAWPAGPRRPRRAGLHRAAAQPAVAH